MTVSAEELAAWADGEIDGARGDAIAAAVDADPALAAQVEAHRALKDRLSAHFAPVLDQPVPERLGNLLAEPTDREAEVVDFAAARSRRVEADSAPRRGLPRWSWVAGPALAASLALAVILPRGGDAPSGVDAELAAVLDDQMVATQQANAETRILLSFRNEDGEYCRAFSARAEYGIACREARGWQMRAQAEHSGRQTTEFRQAATADIMGMVQDMAAGPALDAQGEEAARAAGWRD